MADAESKFDPSTLKPFTAGEPYLGKHQTGLYPGGKNDMPEAHRKAGQAVAATIRPLDAAGKVDQANGRILALVLGHSNCNDYFQALQQHLGRHRQRLHERFEIINAAVSGQQLPEIRALKGRVWDKAEQLLHQGGYAARQVQVLFLHTTYHGAFNAGNRPPGPFPQTMQQMQSDLAAVLEHCVKLYPNLRIAYLTTDGFRHFTGFEPHVWQEAFAVKWLIEAQIEGKEGTAFQDAPDRPRRLPWLSWGLYIWDNTWDRSYFTDGVHPAAKARQIFVTACMKHLRADSVAQPWMFKPAKPAE